MKDPDLFDLVNEYAKNGGRIVFWTCPNKCRDIVDWDFSGNKPVATCKKCGKTSGGEQCSK